MTFRVDSVVLVILGLFLVVFAQDIGALILKHPSLKLFREAVLHRLLYVWPIRVMGVILLVFAFFIARAGPSMAALKSDKNRIALLENGIVIKGTVAKSYYQQLAPKGWKVIYTFTAQDGTSSEQRTFDGSSQGPSKYYAQLLEHDEIEIIYEPSNPKLSSEIRCFLNDPGYRRTFKKAGKLKLLERFRDKYEIEDYSFEQWHREQWHKDEIEDYQFEQRHREQ